MRILTGCGRHFVLRFPFCFLLLSHSLKTTEEGLDALIRLSTGDMRKALNILQSTSMAFDEVSADNVYICTATPLPADIESCVRWMLSLDIASAYDRERREREGWSEGRSGCSCAVVLTTRVLLLV